MASFKFFYCILSVLLVAITFPLVAAANELEQYCVTPLGTVFESPLQFQNTKVICRGAAHYLVKITETSAGRYETHVTELHDDGSPAREGFFAKTIVTETTCSPEYSGGGCPELTSVDLVEPLWVVFPGAPSPALFSNFGDRNE